LILKSTGTGSRSASIPAGATGASLVLDSAGSDGVTLSASFNGTKVGSASISYNYQVAAANYAGTRLAFGGMSSSTAYVQGILDRFPVGKKVPVFYSTNDPHLAVLETGIHGGTWLLLGIGTVFVLGGCLFLQIFLAILTAQATQTKIKLQSPPVLMGIIPVLMGSFAFFVEPAGGTPRWILYAIGSFFILMGLYVLASRLQNKLYSNVLFWSGMLIFLVPFHWVSFGPGERIGTVITPFSRSSGANVRPYFVVATVLMDLISLACLVKWLKKARKD